MGHCFLVFLLMLFMSTTEISTAATAEQNLEIPPCTNKNPCDVVFGNMIDGRLSPMSSQQASCACPNKPCPLGWQENGNRSITMEISNNPVKLLAQFHYCEDVPSVPDCVGSEVALKTLGYGIMPEDIEEYKCRCPGGEALVLKSSLFIPRMYSTRLSYACQIPVCENKGANSPVCITTRRTRYGFVSDVKCSCPENFKCTMSRGRVGHCRAA